MATLADVKRWNGEQLEQIAATIRQRLKVLVFSGDEFTRAMPVPGWTGEAAEAAAAQHKEQRKHQAHYDCRQGKPPCESAASERRRPLAQGEEAPKGDEAHQPHNEVDWPSRCGSSSRSPRPGRRQGGLKS